MITPPKRHMHRESAVQDFVNGLLRVITLPIANRWRLELFIVPSM
jgi:hypothetical protein